MIEVFVSFSLVKFNWSLVLEIVEAGCAHSIKSFPQAEEAGWVKDSGSFEITASVGDQRFKVSLGEVAEAGVGQWVECPFLQTSEGLAEGIKRSLIESSESRTSQRVKSPLLQSAKRLSERVESSFVECSKTASSQGVESSLVERAETGSSQTVEGSFLLGLTWANLQTELISWDLDFYWISSSVVIYIKICTATLLSGKTKRATRCMHSSVGSARDYQSHLRFTSC